jgi:hypothetical protein
MQTKRPAFEPVFSIFATEMAEFSEGVNLPEKD